MTIEREVAAHYEDQNLGRRLLEALAAAGADIERLTLDDLAPVDEFHIGGRAATIELAARLGLGAGMRLLDVGSGIGGPARFMSASRGCAVVGIDLTPAFVEIANDLTRRCGLGGAVTFQQASALALPFAPASFDAATMIHVGMNIQDKATLFQSVRRVLKPGAVFGVYDLMRLKAEGPAYPVPWSSRPETSFLDEPATYRRHLEAAGFAIEAERDRRDFALAFFREMKAKVDAAAAAGGPPMLGTQLIMGPEFPQKMRNARESIERAELAPFELIARAR